MTDPHDLVKRVNATNPVPVPVDPDWDQIKQYVAAAAPTEAGEVAAASGGSRHSAGLNPRANRRTPASAHRRRPPRMLGALAFVAAVAAALLVALAPWSGSSNFLAKAAAALTPPPGSILYERWEHIIVSEPGNPARNKTVTLGPDQLWIEADSPHRYRIILESNKQKTSTSADLASTYGILVSYIGPAANIRPGPNNLFSRLQRAVADEPLELAGTTEAKRPGEVPPTLTFVPPDELLSTRLRVTLGATLPGPHDEAIENSTDPVSALRAAIREGRAHAAGVVQLAGRAVERIDFDLPQQPPAGSPPLPANAPHVTPAPASAYVEPTDFQPVEIDFAGGIYRFLAYEYLSPNAANLALTNIRAQHPDATVIKSVAAKE